MEIAHFDKTSVEENIDAVLCDMVTDTLSIFNITTFIYI